MHHCVVKRQRLLSPLLPALATNTELLSPRVFTVLLQSDETLPTRFVVCGPPTVGEDFLQSSKGLLKSWEDGQCCAFLPALSIKHKQRQRGCSNAPDISPPPAF